MKLFKFKLKRKYPYTIHGNLAFDTELVPCGSLLHVIGKTGNNLSNVGDILLRTPTGLRCHHSATDPGKVGDYWGAHISSYIFSVIGKNN